MAKPLIRTNIGQPKATIEDVYEELKAIHKTLNVLLDEVVAIKKDMSFELSD
jgi:hypothetical protein